MDAKTLEALKGRFEAKLIPEPNSGCWLWIGATAPTNSGLAYGNFYLPGVTSKAHRASWLIYRGPIPDGMNVLHRCDLPLCVNPNHLFLGSQRDNIIDCVRKRRTNPRRGAENHKSKLTTEQAAEIRASSHGTRRLSKRYGVARSTIHAIKCGRTWQEHM